MLSSLIYPIPLLLAFASRLDTFALWGVLLFSTALNIYLLRRNKILKSRLNSQFKSRTDSQTLVDKKDNALQGSDNDSLTEYKFQSRSQEVTMPQSEEYTQAAEIRALEAELNDTIYLKDSISTDHELSFASVEQERQQRTHILEKLLQSLSGWHQSLIPLLLQNIGWFIGILCFISGTVFFISYTQGFSKSVTIFATILSYTLLLAWAGYRLKEKVSQAAMSGNVLMAMSFLLVPLNFTAAAQLMTNSSSSGQYFISLILSFVALLSLFYITRVISGVFNRKLLRFFAGIYFSLSIIQLLVPVLHQSHSLMFLMLLQVSITALLLMAFIAYLPGVMKSLYDNNNYLQLFSIGSLLFAATVSMVHISMASLVTIKLSYYAPVLMLISGALFYMDAQLHEYKSRSSLLSRFSLIAYALSFTAIFLSLDSELSRTITMLSGSLIYARLMWLYRSLVPLYLVLGILGFLHYDLILQTVAWQWYFLMSLPMLGLFCTVLFYLVKSERQREKAFSVTRHLYHFLLLSSLSLALWSQWYSASAFMVLSNGLVALLVIGYGLKSRYLKGWDLSDYRMNNAYHYLFLFLPVIMLLITSNSLLDVDAKLVLITLVSIAYSINSHLLFMTLNENNRNGNQNGTVMDKSLFVNASILISVLLLLLSVIGFELSLKTGLLLIVIALNFLLLSFSLYNRGLFYMFLLIAGMAVLVFKLCLTDFPSTGLLTVSFVVILFYLIHWLDRNKNSELEAFKAKIRHEHNPEKILWCYPCKDISVVNEKDTMEVIENA